MDSRISSRNRIFKPNLLKAEQKRGVKGTKKAAKAPLLIKELETPLKALLDAKSAVINEWITAGKLNAVEPVHLIFSIWAITQHYADFSVQIKAVTGNDLSDPVFFESTLKNIQHIILDGLQPH